MNYFESYPEPVIEHATSEHGAYMILDLPAEALPAAARVVDMLKERAFLVHLLQGEDKPIGMSNPFGIWPHPSAAELEKISQETQLPIRTTEELTAQRRADIIAA